MGQYYKKYMKKVGEQKLSNGKLFIFAFFLMIIFFIIVATHLTLSMDISIGENDEGDIKESGLGVKHLIDSRLRLIQMEDAGSVSIKDSAKEKDTIDTYSKNIETTSNTGYNGDLDKSYGYNETQQTQPYSQTYNNAQKSISVPSATPKPVAATPKPAVTQAPKPVSTTPAYQVQKNLAPTGMN